LLKGNKNNNQNEMLSEDAKEILTEKEIETLLEELREVLDK
jgi:hypothetical protein